MQALKKFLFRNQVASRSIILGANWCEEGAKKINIIITNNNKKYYNCNYWSTHICHVIIKVITQAMKGITNELNQASLSIAWQRDERGMGHTCPSPLYDNIAGCL